MAEFRKVETEVSAAACSCSHEDGKTTYINCSMPRAARPQRLWPPRLRPKGPNFEAPLEAVATTGPRSEGCARSSEPGSGSLTKLTFNHAPRLVVGEFGNRNCADAESTDADEYRRQRCYAEALLKAGQALTREIEFSFALRRETELNRLTIHPLPT